MDFLYKLLLISILCQVISSNVICQTGDYWTGSKCNACSNLIPGCINCQETTGICLTWLINFFANIPPILINSSSNLTTCTCPTGQLFVFNPQTNNYSCNTQIVGNSYYNATVIAAMPANLTLQNMATLRAAAFGVNGNQANEKLQNISTVILGFKTYIKSTLSTDILTQLIGCAIGVAQNSNVNYNSLSNILKITYQILQTMILTQPQMQNLLEFYGLAMGQVSTNNFDFNNAKFDPQKIFLQDIQSQFDTVTKQLLQYYSNSQIQQIILGQSNLRILFQILQTSQDLQLGLNGYQNVINFTSQALQLLPTNGSNYIIYAVQLVNVQEKSPGISFNSFPFSTLNLNFYNINQNNITSANKYFKTLNSSTGQINFIFTANNQSTSLHEVLLTWNTRYLLWDMQEECQFTNNYSKLACSQPNLAEFTLFSVIPYDFTLNQCVEGEFLNQDNTCQVCPSATEHCLLCVGNVGQCSLCEGLLPSIQTINQTTYNYSCSCLNNQIVTYNPSNFIYQCMDSQTAMNTYFNQSLIAALSSNLTMNDLVMLKAAVLAINGASQDAKFDLIIGKLQAAISTTQLYFYFSEVLVGLIRNQYLTNYNQTLNLLYLANNLRAKEQLGLDAINQLAEFFGILFKKVNPNQFLYGTMTEKQIKIFLSSVQTAFDSLIQVFVENLSFEAKSEQILHFTSYYLHIAQLSNTTDLSSKLMAGNYQVNVKKEILSQLPKATIYFSHVQLINNLFEFNSSMKFDGKAFDVNFYYQINATTTTSPRKVSNANSYLTNLQSTIEFSGPDTQKYPNVYLVYYSYSKTDWKYLQPQCQFQLNNTLIMCYPLALSNSNLFAFSTASSSQLKQKIKN